MTLLPLCVQLYQLVCEKKKNYVIVSDYLQELGLVVLLLLATLFVLAVIQNGCETLVRYIQ